MKTAPEGPPLAVAPRKAQPGIATGELRIEVEPRSPFRLPRMHGKDGLTRVRRGVIHRLLHEGELPVLVRVAQLSSGRVLFGARAADRESAARAIARMRVALGVDLDLRPFIERFSTDPLIGAAIRLNPAVRPRGRPDPFEALAWAVTEQLIEYERAAAIQRRMIRSLGRRDKASGLSDSPTARVLAGAAPGRASGASISRAAALSRWSAPRERWRRHVSSCRLRPPATGRSAAGDACSRSPASAPGPSRCWRSAASAGWINSRPAILRSSSWSGGC